MPGLQTLSLVRPRKCGKMEYWVI